MADLYVPKLGHPSIAPSDARRNADSVGFVNPFIASAVPRNVKRLLVHNGTTNDLVCQVWDRTTPPAVEDVNPKIIFPVPAGKSQSLDQLIVCTAGVVVTLSSSRDFFDQPGDDTGKFNVEFDV